MRLILNILILLFAINSFAQKEVTLKPVIKKQAVRIISGNQNNYYALNRNNTIEFYVKGYDRIVIYSRERINQKPLGYTISYNFDGKQDNQYTVNKKVRDYRSAYSDKSINKNVSYFYKKNINLTNEINSVTFKVENLVDVDIKILAYKSGKKTILKPLNNVKKIRIATGKAYKYYKLNSKIPVVIETDREGELVVYTRKRMSNNTSNKYSFTYQIDNSEPKIVTVNNVKKSYQSVYRSLKVNQTPSTYNKTIIKTGEVFQKISFSSNLPVDARFVFKKITKKDGWEELESNSGKIVPLVVKNKKIVKEYTRVEKGKPFEFSINNTEAIKIFIRGEFQYHMHANNDYEIILRDNGKIINTYKLSCHRSKIMQYKFNDELIPGTLDKFIIKVPKGIHKYSISINNKGKTALIRVMKKDNETLYTNLTN